MQNFSVQSAVHLQTIFNFSSFLTFLYVHVHNKTIGKKSIQGIQLFCFYIIGVDLLGVLNCSGRFSQGPKVLFA